MLLGVMAAFVDLCLLCARAPAIATTLPFSETQRTGLVFA